MNVIFYIAVGYVVVSLLAGVMTGLMASNFGDPCPVKAGVMGSLTWPYRVFKLLT